MRIVVVRAWWANSRYPVNGVVASYMNFSIINTAVCITAKDVYRFKACPITKIKWHWLSIKHPVCYFVQVDTSVTLYYAVLGSNTGTIAYSLYIRTDPSRHNHLKLSRFALHKHHKKVVESQKMLLCAIHYSHDRVVIWIMLKILNILISEM